MTRKDHSADDLFSEESEFADEDFESEQAPMIDALDADIVMHRDAHFGGKFEFMLEYYLKEGKGIHPEIETSRIEELAKIEQRSGENLAAVLLSGADAERVARARDAYRKLRDVYELSKAKTTHAKLLADLILSEDDELTNEINAVVKAGSDIVPPLLHLIESKEFYDPLFPGYGMAPVYAAHCLGRLGDKRAIMGLFETIGHGDFFHEDTVCQALKEIGQPAKEFLLKVMSSRPLTEDNERAALALGYFRSDPEVAKACLGQLQLADVWPREMLASYLILACEGLTDKKDQSAFLALSKKPNIQLTLKRDIETVGKSWK